MVTVALVWWWLCTGEFTTSPLHLPSDHVGKAIAAKITIWRNRLPIGFSEEWIGSDSRLYSYTPLLNGTGCSVHQLILNNAFDNLGMRNMHLTRASLDQLLPGWRIVVIRPRWVYVSQSWTISVFSPLIARHGHVVFVALSIQLHWLCSVVLMKGVSECIT